jgi:SAM-dependent methyltransferase
MNKLYVQYGCGLCAPSEWLNYDTSPTLRIQKIPLVGRVLKRRLNTVFPEAVRYGDIVKGLPLPSDSCDAVYCSHVLEHLSLNDFRVALKNTLRILKPGGLFRCVVPDLEVLAKRYLESLHAGNNSASIDFIGKGTLLGVVERARGLKGLATTVYGNAHHLWMWDHSSLAVELTTVGFKGVRRAAFNDSSESKFALVEDKERFGNAVALECTK